MAIAAAASKAQRRGVLQTSLDGVAKCVLGTLFCLTPVTALVVLGWMTRKTAGDIAARRSADPHRCWPNFILAEEKTGTRWSSRWFGGLVANVAAGAKAWAAVLLITLPFSLVWLAAWVAGWENSFSKGYELAGIWPVTGFFAVFASLPILVLCPMAIAHQAASGTVASVFEFRKIVALARAAGWRYLGFTLLIGIGCVGVFGVRGMPVFAEQISERVASGDAAAIASYAGEFKLGMTALLFAGLLVIRNVMARVYVFASEQCKVGKTSNMAKAAVVFLLAATMWLGAVFLIHFAQFLNYSWWSWVNQPVVMLPWLGILR